MSYTRLSSGTLTGSWNTSQSGPIYTASWSYSEGVQEQIIGHLSPTTYLLLPDDTLLNIPASGYTQFYVDIYMKVAGYDNYIVSKRTLDDTTFADGLIEYFLGNNIGELYKTGCEGGRWHSTSGSFTLRLYSNGNLTLNVLNPRLTQSVSLTGNLKRKVTSVLFECGLRAVNFNDPIDYIFDGIATPNGEHTPTLDHTWSEYNTSTCPSIVYYGKANGITTYTPVRYELIATDDTASVITYTIPYLYTHFYTRLNLPLHLSKIDAYKYTTRTGSDYILSCDIARGSTRTTFLMTIADFSNGKGSAGSAIYLNYIYNINYFYWDNIDGSSDASLVDIGLPVATVLTAFNWTRLQTKINELLTAFGVTPTSFTTVHTRDRILATYYQEIRTALSTLPSAAIPVLPPWASSGTTMYAYLFNGNIASNKPSIKHVLNTAITYYNDQWN